MVWNLFPESGAPLAQTRFQPSCSLNLRFPQKSQFLETYCFNSLIGKGRGTNDDTGEINVPSWSFKSFNNLKMESKRCLGPNLLEHRRKITGQARYKSSHPSGGEQRKEREKAMLFELKIAWRSATWWTSSLIAGRETWQWEWKGPGHQSNQTGSGQHFKERERKDTPIGRQIQQSLMVAYRDYNRGNNSWREKYIIPLMG